MKSNDSLRCLLLLTCWAGLSCGDPNVLQFAADPPLIVNSDFPLVVTVTFETNLPCLARGYSPRWGSQPGNRLP